MPLDTEFLSKNPTIRLHRPSVRPSVALHSFPPCPIFHTSHELLAHRLSNSQHPRYEWYGIRSSLFSTDFLISCC